MSVIPFLAYLLTRRPRPSSYVEPPRQPSASAYMSKADMDQADRLARKLCEIERTQP